MLIDKIALIYLKDGKILSSRSRGKDIWYLPGGKREADESDLETLIREIKEELDVEIITETVRPYGVFEAQAHGKKEGILVRMTCYTAEFSGEEKASGEIEALAYLGAADAGISSPVDQLIFEDLRKKGLLY